MFPQHPGAWTLDEVLALPEDQGYRLELVDGLIVISPSPTSGISGRCNGFRSPSVVRALPSSSRCPASMSC